MIESSIIFSIIIPTFNSSKCIGRCISSILGQNDCSFEVIVIDNYSSDDTISILERFDDPRIKIFVKKDSGPYEAMNTGINLAKGNWLYFLGSDDYFFENSFLSSFSKYLLDLKFSIVYGNVLISGNSGWAKDGEIYAGYFSKNRMLRKAICHQAIFYKREFLLSNNLLFDLSYPVSADWHLNLRCRRLTRFKYVDMVIAVFSAGGISTIKKDSFREQIKIEFADMLPSRIEVQVKEGLKRIIRWFK